MADCAGNAVSRPVALKFTPRRRTAQNYALLNRIERKPAWLGVIVYVPIGQTCEGVAPELVAAVVALALHSASLSHRYPPYRTNRSRDAMRAP